MADPELTHIRHQPVVELPPEPKGWDGFKKRRICKRAYGGHFWHPADAMILWGCCNCGTRRDGMPKDGT